MSEQPAGWQHPGPPPHICNLPSPSNVPPAAKPYESTWKCECGNVFTFRGVEEEQVGPDEFQPYTQWQGPELENVPPWATVRLR